MASKKNNTNTAAAVVNSVVENAKTPNMENNKTREVLGDEIAKEQRFVNEVIVSYVPMRGTGSSIRASINTELQQKAKQFPNGKAKVKLMGCKWVQDIDSGNEWYSLVVKASNGAEKSVCLYPGYRTECKNGMVKEPGWIWAEFYEELKKQRNELGEILKGRDLDEAFKKDCTSWFMAWFLYDGKSTKMFVSEWAYNKAVEKLAIATGKVKETK